MSSRLRSQLIWRTPEPRLAVKGFMAPAAESTQDEAKFTVQVAPREQAIHYLSKGEALLYHPPRRS